MLLGHSAALLSLFTRPFRMLLGHSAVSTRFEVLNGSHRRRAFRALQRDGRPFTSFTFLPGFEPQLAVSRPFRSLALPVLLHFFDGLAKLRHFFKVL